MQLKKHNTDLFIQTHVKVDSIKIFYASFILQLGLPYTNHEDSWRGISQMNILLI